MIYQLPNGRIIEMSVEQFLFLSESDLQELNGIHSSYSTECNNPFYNSFNNQKQVYDIDDKNIPDEIYEVLMADEDFTKELFEIDDNEKIEDEDFYIDD
jgi:hypothetical protein